MTDRIKHFRSGRSLEGGEEDLHTPMAFVDFTFLLVIALITSIRIGVSALDVTLPKAAAGKPSEALFVTLIKPPGVAVPVYRLPEGAESDAAGVATRAAGKPVVLIVDAGIPVQTYVDGMAPLAAKGLTVALGVKDSGSGVPTPPRKE